jgi:hypothetical protein
MKMKMPVLDDIEQIFLTYGPDHGLHLSKRRTAIDLVATAYADDLINPPRKSEYASDERTLFLINEFSNSLEQRSVQDGIIPTFYRKGSIEFLGEIFRFDFALMGGDGQKLDSQEQVDEVIAKKEYSISFGFYYPKHCENHTYVFDATVEKSFDGINEKNSCQLAAMKPPCNHSNTSCKLLYTRLQKLASKYPGNMIINTKQFAMDFLKALK